MVVTELPTRRGAGGAVCVSIVLSCPELLEIFLRSPLPVCRISASMKHGQHHDGVGLDQVEDAVGEPAHEEASHVPVNHWVLFRRADDPFQCGIDTRNEFGTETHSALLIPIMSVANLVLSGWAQDEPPSHLPRIRAFTVDQSALSPGEAQ